MKNFLRIVLFCMIVQTSFSQTAADYYLPLCVGNYLKFNTPGNGITTNGGWEGRATYNSIIREDSINGEAYYLQKGYEVMDFDGSINVFHYFWLRKANNGDILIGAYDLTQNGILDSATLVPSGSTFFSSQFLTLGYTRTIVMGPGSSTVDSVVSVSETVGAHTNCILIRTTRKNSGVIDMVEDTYYAFQLGKIKIERTLPAWQVHVDNIVDSVDVNCYLTGISDDLENDKYFVLYPNPASDFITLNAGNIDLSGAIINIYDVVGKLVSEGAVLYNQQQIDVRDLISGIYMVEIKTKGRTEIQKLAIRR